MTEEEKRTNEGFVDAAQEDIDPTPAKDATVESDIPKPPSKIGVTATADQPKPPPKVTLSDVQETFPHESSEERIVMEHIERTNPTVGNEDGEYEVTEGGQRIYKAPASRMSSSIKSATSLLQDGTALPPELR
ncbi:MAG: hypothetical protein SGARI_007561 [Bacillariaceae sp.]